MLGLLEYSFFAKLVVSIFCGGIIGVERQFRGKAIGIRTSILICLSTQVFVRLSLHLEGVAADPTRVLGQVVTGVGFLGAGVIMARGGSVTVATGRQTGESTQQGDRPDESAKGQIGSRERFGHSTTVRPQTLRLPRVRPSRRADARRSIPKAERR